MSGLIVLIYAPAQSVSVELLKIFKKKIVWSSFTKLHTSSTPLHVCYLILLYIQV